MKLLDQLNSAAFENLILISSVQPQESTLILS
jgi:hypothetical protein